MKLLDVSADTDRYNLFVLTEGEEGEATFPYLGDYEYKAYQMPNDLATNVALGRLVESGKVRVVDPPTEIIAYKPTTTAKVYGK